MEKVCSSWSKAWHRGSVMAVSGTGTLVFTSIKKEEAQHLSSSMSSWAQHFIIVVMYRTTMSVQICMDLTVPHWPPYIQAAIWGQISHFIHRSIRPVATSSVQLLCGKSQHFVLFSLRTTDECVIYELVPDVSVRPLLDLCLLSVFSSFWRTHCTTVQCKSLFMSLKPECLY